MNDLIDLDLGDSVVLVPNSIQYCRNSAPVVRSLSTPLSLSPFSSFQAVKKDNVFETMEISMVNCETENYNPNANEY